MKALITADWHYTDKTPESRIDNYPVTMIQKIMYILSVAKEEMVDLILQTGDLTDSPFLSYATFIRISELLRTCKIRILTIYGQHDLRYRNKGNTPLDALYSNNAVEILTPSPVVLTIYPEIDIYGCSFGETYPEIQDPNKFNILVIHKMIVPSQDKEWEKEGVLSSYLLESTNFDLIASGDNHKSFTAKSKDGRDLINCGSLMRSTIDQIDHEPFFVIYDTKTRSFQKYFISIKPWKEVFNLEKIVKEEERNENLEEFGKSLMEQKDMGLDFILNLQTYMQTNNCEPEVKTIIDECITV